MDQHARLPLWLLILALAALTFVLAAPAPSRWLVGQVLDAAGPVADAEVRFQASPLSVRSDAGGRFRLPWPSNFRKVTVSRDGYFIGGGLASPEGVRLYLEKLPTEDATDYAWVDPTPDPAGAHNCGNCHGAIFREWSASGHARSVTNRRFLNLYDGSDWQGRHGVGWGLLVDHPAGAGVCTSCHAPTVGFGDPAYYDLRKASGVDRQGVHCDYCHKIAGTETETFGLTHGRFGLRLLRPTEGQLFFGPLPDVDRGEDAYAPIYRESRYCASCHEGTVFGVPVYTTYSEYLESPARRAGKQCQDCHLAPTGTMTNIAPGHGGVERDPQTLGNHRFFAGGQTDMLRRCLTVSGEMTRKGDAVRVDVAVQADGVGHRVPTGFIDRNLLLVVEGWHGNDMVTAREAPQLPAMAGANLAGRPGRLYAKSVADFEEHRPAPFWNANPETTDTRLVPGMADRSVYTFPPHVDRVRYRLLYCRFWPEVADAKGWPDDTVVVHEGEWRLPGRKGSNP